MAETVRKSKLMFLKIFAKLFASILSLLGVISGCETISADYGVEGVFISGQTLSAADSTNIPGIQVKLSSNDSTEVFGETIADQSGYFNLSVGTGQISLPDSVRLTATDIDGEENGSFAEKDILFYMEEQEDYSSYYINLYMQEDDE